MRFSAFVRATLAGVAQVVFCERALAGSFLLVAAAVLSPSAAFGALAGAALATALRLPGEGERADWQLGLAGFNAAIVGMFWAGPLARLEASATLFPVALLGCLTVENVLRPHFRRLGLPMLGAPALLVGWMSDWTFRAFGDSLWVHPGTLPFGDWSLPLAVACLGMAVATRSLLAAVTVGAIAIIASSWSAWWFGMEGPGPATLWAYAVAPAALGGFSIVPLARLHAICAAILAAILAAAVWFLWIYTPLLTVLPPLLAPCLIGVWGAIAAIVHRGGSLILDPGLWRLAALMTSARHARKPIVVLSGAGASTASGIPDYISGAWLDPAVPPRTYAFGAFLASESCRRAYWSACARFRAVASAARPNAVHAATAALQRAGYVSTIITQNVDGLHQAAGSPNVVEIHGAIDRCRCVSCGAVSEWPAPGAWEVADLRCAHCGGLLKPAVVAMGEDVPTAAMRAAQAAVAECGVLLVVGSQLAVSSAASLLAQARRNGARIVFINLGPLAQAVGLDDLILDNSADRVLRALAFLLGISEPFRTEAGALCSAGQLRLDAQ
ncbi:MAG TPA: urea transporter [Alphaproteobacteria bacterium]|nr:urea transporter [Alphaproteobacteria bacterium]